MLQKKYVEAKWFFTSVFTVHQAVTHCSQGQLEGVADLLWGPLFENSQNAEETTRNVAAACLGKLATIAPSRYLPELHVTTLTLPQMHLTDIFLCQARIRDPNPDIRATVVSAIRYTFADVSRSYDELLSPLIVDFLSLMADENLVGFFTYKQ